MRTDPKHLEVTLETQVESVNLAEEMCLRVAEAAGFGEDDCYRIGMSVREGVINAFHYGNQERPEKKIHLAVDLTDEKMILPTCPILWQKKIFSVLQDAAFF